MEEEEGVMGQVVWKVPERREQLDGLFAVLTFGPRVCSPLSPGGHPRGQYFSRLRGALNNPGLGR